MTQKDWLTVVDEVATLTAELEQAGASVKPHHTRAEVSLEDTRAQWLEAVWPDASETEVVAVMVRAYERWWIHPTKRLCAAIVTRDNANLKRVRAGLTWSTQGAGFELTQDAAMALKALSASGDPLRAKPAWMVIAGYMTFPREAVPRVLVGTDTQLRTLVDAPDIDPATAPLITKLGD